MLGDDALELEIAILQHGEVRRELATGFGEPRFMSLSVHNVSMFYIITAP